MAAPSPDEIDSLLSEEVLGGDADLDLTLNEMIDGDVDTVLATDDSPLEALDESSSSPKLLNELNGFGSHIALGQASERELLSEAMRAVGGIDDIIEKKQSRQALLQARKEHMLRSSIQHAVDLRAENDFHRRASTALSHRIREGNDTAEILRLIESEKTERVGIEDLQKASSQLLSATKQELLPKWTPHGIPPRSVYVRQEQHAMGGVGAGVPVGVMAVQQPTHFLQPQQTALERVQAHFSSMQPGVNPPPAPVPVAVPMQPMYQPVGVPLTHYHHPHHTQQQMARWGRSVSPSRFRPGGMQQLRFPP